MNPQHYFQTPMTRTLLVTFALASLAFAGCTAPAGPNGPLSALAAIGIAHDEALDVGAGSLVFVSGAAIYTPDSPHAVDGLSEAWAYGYHDSVSGGSKVIQVDDEGAAVGQEDEVTSHLASLPWLDATGLLDSDAVAEIAQREGFVPENPNNGDATIYWLAVEEGRPLWTIEFRAVGGATEALQIDARTGDVVEAPLQLSYGEALASARAEAQQWNSGSVLAEAEGVERIIGSFGYLAYDIRPEDGVLSPPDPVAQDGLAPVWGFVFYDESTGLSRSFAALRDGSVHPGPERDRGDMEALPEPAYGAADLVALAESDHPSLAARYQYRMLAGEPVWILDVRVGDEGEGWIMDAMTGDLRES